MPTAAVAAAALAGCAYSRGAHGAQAQGSASSVWSAPATLSSCGGQVPQVVFPSNQPTHGTGPGAIVWNAARACPEGEEARVAAIGSDDRPESRRASPRIALPSGSPGGLPGGALAVAAAPHGRIAIVGQARGSGGGGAGGALAIQGRASGPFRAIAPGGALAAPYALSTGYLGDLALASRAGGVAGPLQLQVERFFASGFVRSAQAAPPAGLQALTVALDYRSDALVVWVQNGALSARSLPAKGSIPESQRLASVGANVHLSAVLSDDYRATVAWSEQRGDQTSVYLDRSSTGVRFARPQLLERFEDVHGSSPPPASPSLIRLSTESVVLAWAGVSAGRWVVRVAPLDEDAMGSRATLASPGGDALLTGVTAGPMSDMLVLWSEPAGGQRPSGSASGNALWAARGFRVPPDRMWFAPPEEVTPSGAGGEASAAFDPGTDRAVAAWRAAGGSIQFAVREATGHPAIPAR